MSRVLGGGLSPEERRADVPFVQMGGRRSSIQKVGRVLLPRDEAAPRPMYHPVVLPSGETVIAVAE